MHAAEHIEITSPHRETWLSLHNLKPTSNWNYLFIDFTKYYM